MLRLVLASIGTGAMAFAAVAFWPSSGPSREVSIAVVQPASTKAAVDGISDLLQGSRAGEEETIADGEVELASLKNQESLSFEPPSEESEVSSFDGAASGAAGTTGVESADEPSADEDPSALSDETDQAFVGPDGEALPQPPVRKPARAKSDPPPTDYSLLERVAEIGPGAIARLEAKFSSAGVAWPPRRLAFLVFKDEKVIEVQAQSEGSRDWDPVYRYEVEAASGSAGPKLVQGDKQVPEGLYKIVSLNPNSRYHVSLRVGYPNDFDRAMAKADGRKNLGGDIMIHGKNLSAGCLAVGDEGSEEFFVMAHSVGLENVDVIIAPRDFRKPSVFASVKETINLGGPTWLPTLYESIKVALEPFPEMPPKVAPTIAQK